MIKLRNYIDNDAKTILTWINDEYSFKQWSADRYDKFPINADEMNSFYHKCSDNSHVFTAIDEFNNIVGHFILRYPNINDKKIVRLGFVIVNNEIRGKGIGKQMVSLAIKYAFNQLKANKLTIGVFENNINAINCYKSCGFKASGQIENYNFSGEIWNCIEMYINNV